MSEIIVIARLRVMATDLQLAKYREQLEELEPNQRGLLGFSFWRSLEPDGGIMQVMRYRDQQVADEALEALIQSKPGPLVQSVTIDPPNVDLMAPKQQHGKLPEQVPIGSYVSFAQRYADPGLQEDLEMDTEEVLSELHFIPGYLGSIWGNDVTLSEEIISMAFWANEDALMSSIPTSHKVKIAAYQRVV
jgi:hypothetical protein